MLQFDESFIQSIRPDNHSGHQYGDDFTYLSYISLYLFAAPFARNQKVLDAGCGLGFGSYLLSKRAATVRAIDIDPLSIEYAKQHYKQSNLTYLQADACKTDFPADSFDLIVTFEVLEHIEKSDTEKFLLELRRLLKKDGLLILSTPNKPIYDQISKTPGHINEMAVPELFALLSRFFSDIEPFYQRKGELEHLRHYYKFASKDRFALRRFLPRRLRHQIHQYFAPTRHGNWNTLLERTCVKTGRSLDDLSDAVIQVARCRNNYSKEFEIIRFE